MGRSSESIGSGKGAGTGGAEEGGGKTSPGVPKRRGSGLLAAAASRRSRSQTAAPRSSTLDGPLSTRGSGSSLGGSTESVSVEGDASPESPGSRASSSSSSSSSAARRQQRQQARRDKKSKHAERRALRSSLDGRGAAKLLASAKASAAAGGSDDDDDDDDAAQEIEIAAATTASFSASTGDDERARRRRAGSHSDRMSRRRLISSRDTVAVSAAAASLDAGGGGGGGAVPVPRTAGSAPGIAAGAGGGVGGTSTASMLALFVGICDYKTLNCPRAVRLALQSDATPRAVLAAVCRKPSVGLHELEPGQVAARFTLFRGAADGGERLGGAPLLTTEADGDDDDDHVDDDDDDGEGNDEARLFAPRSEGGLGVANGARLLMLDLTTEPMRALQAAGAAPAPPNEAELFPSAEDAAPPARTRSYDHTSSSGAEVATRQVSPQLSRTESGTLVVVKRSIDVFGEKMDDASSAAAAAAGASAAAPSSSKGRSKQALASSNSVSASGVGSGHLRSVSAASGGAGSGAGGGGSLGPQSVADPLLEGAVLFRDTTKKRKGKFKKRWAVLDAERFLIFKALTDRSPPLYDVDLRLLSPRLQPADTIAKGSGTGALMRLLTPAGAYEFRCVAVSGPAGSSGGGGGGGDDTQAADEELGHWLKTIEDAAFNIMHAAVGSQAEQRVILGQQPRTPTTTTTTAAEAAQRRTPATSSSSASPPPPQRRQSPSTAATAAAAAGGSGNAARSVDTSAAAGDEQPQQATGGEHDGNGPNVASMFSSPTGAPPAPLASARALPGNDSCADCGSADTSWASMNLGCFVCIECVGAHRALGAHISKPRSCDMDVREWTPASVDHMRKNGNTVVNAHYLAHVPDFVRTPTKDTPMKERIQFARAKYELKWFVAAPSSQH